jgi:integrase
VDGTGGAVAVCGESDDQLVAWHLEDLRLANLRPGTIYQRSRVLHRLRATIAPTTLLDATHRDLARFLARDIKPESRAVETTHVRRFYDWAIDLEYLEISPARRIRRPKVPRGRPQPISEPDLDVAIAAARPRIRPWLLLAAYAGLRACEIAPLRAEDLIWDGQPPHIVIREGKGGHADDVAMPSFLADQLATCDLPLTGWLFPRRDGGAGHIPAHLVSRYANQHLHALGIPRTLHKLRHRYGTQILRSSGGNMRTAQVALRHASITSTQRYTLVDLDEVAGAAEHLPRLASITTLPSPPRHHAVAHSPPRAA